ncbi:MAG: hypothetical protein J7647_22320 [Cyanobacteria bacterium SBLK]|nr:hypothetical protein [Cyanobacteria bacterium SBLK]
MSIIRRSSRWREVAQKRIKKVIKLYLKANPERPVNLNALKKEISKAYPFGERKNHPYKIWLSEVKNQLKYYETIRFDPQQPPKIKLYSPLRGKPKKSPPPPPGQLSLDLDIPKK